MKRRALLRRAGATVAVAALGPLVPLAPRPFATGGVVYIDGVRIGELAFYRLYENRFYDAPPYYSGIRNVTITITGRVENMDALRRAMASLDRVRESLPL